jgi:cytochrome c oxidase subunit 3/cytochrome o ubiquinol oxidase subunit 3
MNLNTNIFSSSFYVLTGFHGLHVTLGIIWLLTLVWVSLRGGLKQKDAVSVDVAGLYWHFVDIVWIVIFVLVYLIPYQKVEGAGESGGHSAEGAFRVVQQAIEALPF